MLNWNTKTFYGNIYQNQVTSTKWWQFWSCRIKASYRFALHRRLSYAPSLCHHIGCRDVSHTYQLIMAWRLRPNHSLIPLRRPRPEPSCLLAPSSWQADKSCLPRIPGELLSQQPWVVLDCCPGSGSSMNVWNDSLNYQWLRIHTSDYQWGNNSLTKNVMLIYTTITQNNIYANTFRCR